MNMINRFNIENFTYEIKCENETIDSKIEFDEAIGKYNCYDTSLCLDAMLNYNLKIGVIVRKDLVHYSVGKGILNQDFLKDEYSMRRKFNLPIPDNIKQILEK